MSEPTETKEERRDHQTKGQFEALGRFVQAFELMVNACRMGCSMLVGPTGKQGHYINIMLNHQSMSAQPLLDILRAMMATRMSDPDSGSTAAERKVMLEILAQIGREYQELASKRNEILHGTWFIGWASAEQADFSSMIGIKLKVKPTEGLAQATLPENVETVTELCARCHATERLIHHMFGAMLIGKYPTPAIVKEEGTWKVVDFPKGEKP